MSALYQADYHLWVRRQAQLLRDQQFDDLDVADLVDALLDLAKRERKELKRLVKQLMWCVLKSQLNPGYVSDTCRGTLAEQRDGIIEKMQKMPAIVPLLDDYFANAYEKAASKLARKAGLPRSSFAATLPWPKEQLLEEGFMPWTEAERKRPSADA